MHAAACCFLFSTNCFKSAWFASSFVSMNFIFLSPWLLAANLFSRPDYYNSYSWVSQMFLHAIMLAFFLRFPCAGKPTINSRSLSAHIPQFAQVIWLCNPAGQLTIVLPCSVLYDFSVASIGNTQTVGKPRLK
jgi:hypothetical protein